MKKFIVIMLLALVSAVTTKAQNVIQWVTFQKEMPMSNQDFIAVFKTADVLQGKTCQIAGTNIIYIYNIRPSVARSIFINNLVGMGFPVHSGNVEEFIRDYCYIGPWPLGKSAYKTANYFLDQKGNPVANGYTYNGGAGVWALWIKEFHVPISKINCMQAQACNFRLPKQVPATPVAKEKQVVQPTVVYPVNYASAPAPQRKTTTITYRNETEVKAGWSGSVAFNSLQECFSNALNGNTAGAVLALAGGVSLSKTPASKSVTEFNIETTGQDNDLRFMAAGLPNNQVQNNQNNSDNNGCNTSYGAVTYDGNGRSNLPWRNQ